MADKTFPSIRSDGTSSPREVALLLLALRRLLLDLERRLTILENTP